ncbi:DUF4041 domain-containing protein [Sporosarcina sp. G11-34]|uniref:DUF4041 domain-containing protein n=1 Tax=Sporosarcina sp. G11-34 TaxID=2849605 RepID=UPI0022A98D3A|nr:DUF4041 domain-containing protein [Sporosarcina sp. G11-34]MCZ2260763.1 DUF4041 domain-containing protein [Sporosarcina sp. G11-34]
MLVSKKKYLFTVERLDELNKELSVSNEEIKLLKNEVDKLERTTSKNDTELEKGKNEIISLKNKITSEIATQRKIAIEVDALTKLKLKNENEISSLNIVKSEQESKLIVLDQKNKELEKQLTELKSLFSNYRAARSELDKIATETELIKKKNSELINEKQNLNSEINKIVSDKLNIVANKELLEYEKLKKSIAEMILEYETRKVGLIELNNSLVMLDGLNQKIQDAKKQLKELEDSIARADDEKKLQEVAFYKNVYPFSTTEEFKEELVNNYSAQKLMIRNKDAIHVGVIWEVSGSVVEGRKMTDKLIKSTIRAFNIDCDNAIAGLRYSNYSTVLKRIENSCATLDKLNTPHKLTINKEFYQLKLNELKIVYEQKIFEEKEKEKLNTLKEEERERKAVEKEIKEKLNELNQREKSVNNELNKINKEFADSKGLNVELLDKIKELEDNLNLITKKKVEVNERHLIGKSGYVYVVSNVGTLGENVYKIGMTRRLEPKDRIRELSGAGVPFQYDVHAMILTDNAPELENHLHKVFNSTRVNLVNTRKEFFYVQLEEIKREIVSVIGPEVIFEDNYLAVEFYMSQALRNNSSANIAEDNTDGMYSSH